MWALALTAELIAFFASETSAVRPALVRRSTESISFVRAYAATRVAPCAASRSVSTVRDFSTPTISAARSTTPSAFSTPATAR